MATNIGKARYEEGKDRVWIDTKEHFTVALLPDQGETATELILRMRADKEWRSKVMLFEGQFGVFGKLKTLEVLDL